jgi:hypothetical protein
VKHPDAFIENENVRGYRSRARAAHRRGVPPAIQLDTCPSLPHFSGWTRLVLVRLLRRDHPRGHRFRRRRSYLPVQTGCRFSPNAVAPSNASALEKTTSIAS